MCGWADGYTNAAVRMINGLTCPHRVVIGPWGHTYPHIARPGPQIGFLQEATRWWDRWLKDIANGIDEEPTVCIYMQDTVPPQPAYDERDGRWIASSQWPLEGVTSTVLHLSGSRLQPSAGPEEVLSVCTPIANAIHGWEWLPHGVGPEMPLDQRLEDVGSLCFDTEVLQEPIEICGHVTVQLSVSSDTPTGTVCVRLSDVQPDGQSTLITYELLDLTRHKGMEQSAPLVPSEWFDVNIPLNAIAQNVPAGHRLRLSVSTQSWPLSWPAPDRMTLSVRTDGCSISIPVRSPDAPDGRSPEFAPAVLPQQPDITWVRNVDRKRTVLHDIFTGETTRTYVKDDGAFVVDEHGMLIDTLVTVRFSSVGEDQMTVRASFDYTIKLSRDDWQVELTTMIDVTHTSDAFVIKGQYRAEEGGRDVFVREADVHCQRLVTDCMVSTEEESGSW
jgi:predicted acyl esterase